MYWYNPRTRRTETLPAPMTDEGALALLEGDLNTMAFVAEYERLREAAWASSRRSSSRGTSSGSSNWSSGRPGNHRTRRAHGAPAD